MKVVVVDRTLQLTEIVRDLAVQNLVNFEGTQTIQIEPIDIIILNDGKLIAEYSHRITVKYRGRDAEDQSMKESLLAFLESLAAELRSLDRAVMSFEPAMAMWDEIQKCLKGVLSVRM